MLDTIFGTKFDTVQRFTQDGKRIPVTRIKTGPCFVVRIKSKTKDGYDALQLGWGEKRIDRIDKSLKKYFKGAKLKKAPCYLNEVRADKVSHFKVGDEIKLIDVLKPGDKIKVSGWSKGKGFTGVVKRWGFAGGPRTRGQSDRERAPGSIGQTTTPGRVFKGKKMAGRVGGAKVTVSDLTVMDVDLENNLLLVKGLVPGPKRGRLIIKKMGEEKKFVPLMKAGEKEIRETEEEKAERLRKEKEAEERLKKVEKEEGKEEKETKETKEVKETKDAED